MSKLFLVPVELSECHYNIESDVSNRPISNCNQKPTSKSMIAKVDESQNSAASGSVSTENKHIEESTSPREIVCDIEGRKQLLGLSTASAKLSAGGARDSSVLHLTSGYVTSSPSSTISDVVPVAVSADNRHLGTQLINESFAQTRPHTFKGKEISFVDKQELPYSWSRNNNIQNVRSKKFNSSCNPEREEQISSRPKAVSEPIQDRSNVGNRRVSDDVRLHSSVNNHIKKPSTIQQRPSNDVRSTSYNNSADRYANESSFCVAPVNVHQKLQRDANMFHTNVERIAGIHESIIQSKVVSSENSSRNTSEAPVPNPISMHGIDVILHLSSSNLNSASQQHKNTPCK